MHRTIEAELVEGLIHIGRRAKQGRLLRAWDVAIGIATAFLEDYFVRELQFKLLTDELLLQSGPELALDLGLGPG